MEILGFIPARGGSERVSGKNIKPLNGKPLIAYTIEAAKRSTYINKIVVSTDASEIAGIAKQYGAEVPFMRPDEISGRDSTEMEFFNHMLDSLRDICTYNPDLIVLLYPTSPFRKAETIDRAIAKMIDRPDADSLRSVRKCAEHPYKMWVVDNDRLVPFVKEGVCNMHTLSYHLLPEVFIQNASIYITKPATIREKQSPTGDIIVPFVMDDIESIDINSPLDFRYAEMLCNEGEIQ